MTEDEAKTKWCPMVRFHNGLDGDVYCSRPTGVVTNNSAKCIASDCMMWKWDIKLNRELAKDRHPEELERIKFEGDCGLKTKVND